MPKYDPRYVRMIAQYFAVNNQTGEYDYIEIPLIQCTQKEWEKFYPPSSDALSYFKTIMHEDQNDVKDAFLCLNLNKEQSNLRPNYNEGLTIAYVPCSRVVKYGEEYGNDYQMDEDCIDDEA